MSYTIVYDRKFIRTSRGFIPMILSGSNNCTEQVWRGGRYVERRAREWWSWTPTPLPLKDLPESEYLKAISAHCADSSGYELCKWQGNWLYESQWGKWFKRGCATARTLEEYLAYNRDQSFVGRIVVYPDRNKVSSQHELYAYLHTTQELEDWLDQAHTRLPELKKELGADGDAYIYLCFDGNEPLVMGPRKVEGPVVAKRGSGYVTSYLTGKSLSLSPDPAAAIVFNSVEDAQTKLGSCWDLKYIKASGALREKNYILQFREGRFGHGYLRKRTSGFLYATYNTELARRFRSKDEVIQYARKLCASFPSIGNRFTVVDLAGDASEEFEVEKEAA